MIESQELGTQVNEYVSVCEQRAGQREDILLSRRLARLQLLHGRDSDAASGYGASSDDPANASESSRTVVINLGERLLTEMETKVLERGMGFAVNPRQVSAVDFAASVEIALRDADVSDRAWLRREVVSLMKNFKVRNDNLSPDERKALKSLRSMEDVIFLPADKGNSTVVLDRSSYEVKVASLINEGPYKELKSDLGQRFRSCLLYTSPSPRDLSTARMPSSA